MKTRTHAFLIAALSLAAHGGSAAAATHEVGIVDFVGFVPEVLTIQPGDTVVWRNTTGSEHNVLADNRSFGNAVGRSWTYSHTFTEAGDKPYHCQTHGAPKGIGMSGVIRVAGGAAAFSINEGVQGSWLNNATGGQGVFFDVAPGLDNLFAMAWFTWTQAPGQYDWLTAVGSYAGDRAQMNLFRSRGGRFNAADAVTTTQVGVASVVFTSCTAAELTFALTDPPVSGRIPLQRLLPATAICISANPSLAGSSP